MNYHSNQTRTSYQKQPSPSTGTTQAIGKKAGTKGKRQVTVTASGSDAIICLLGTGTTGQTSTYRGTPLPRVAFSTYGRGAFSTYGKAWIK